MDVVLTLALIVALAAWFVALPVWVASRTYRLSMSGRVVTFIVLWIATTLIGALVWTSAQARFRRTRGIVAVQTA